MTEATRDGTTTGTDGREARAVTSGLIVYDLGDEIERLRSEAEWQEGDRNTIGLVKEGELRVLLSALREGAELSESDPEGRVAIQVLEGRVQVDAEGNAAPLAAGQVGAIDAGRAWTITAQEESILLLTFAWPVQPATVPGDTGKA